MRKFVTFMTFSAVVLLLTGCKESETEYEYVDPYLTEMEKYTGTYSVNLGEGLERCDWDPFDNTYASTTSLPARNNVVQIDISIDSQSTYTYSASFAGGMSKDEGLSALLNTDVSAMNFDDLVATSVAPGTKDADGNSYIGVGDFVYTAPPDPPDVNY